MKLTKYDHACFSVEHQESVILVDPGENALDVPLDSRIDIVYFTHEHDDHCSVSNLQQIVRHNPQVMILGSDAIARKLSEFDVHIVSPADILDLEAFHLRFYGDTHASVHPDLPSPINIGVMINERIYYPGDSFTPCSTQPEVLLLPISGNWMKLQDAIDLMTTLRPSQVIPTHYAPLSDVGKTNALHWIEHFASAQQTKLCDVGQPIELEDN